MKKLVFATNNQNKLKEVRKALPNLEIVSLKEIECFEELAEEQDTLQGNAQQKAEYVYKTYGVPCFADDTGLLINALDGAPGVYSARYAGPKCDSEDNMDLVLKNLEGLPFYKAKDYFSEIVLSLSSFERLYHQGYSEMPKGTSSD